MMLFRHLLRSIFVALAFLSALTAYAQETAVASTPAMWVVEANDSRVYLLGSMHALPPEVYPLSPEVEAAYLDADVVVFEIDTLNPEELGMQLIQQGLFMDGLTLETVAGKDLVARSADVLEPIGIPVEAIQMMQPWIVSFLVGITAAEGLGLEEDIGLDNYFMERAIADEKEVAALETIEDQIDIFASLAMEQQVSLLRRALDELDQASEMLADLLHAWRIGDTERLAELTHYGMDEYPGLRAAMLDDRNRAWTPQIVEMLSVPGRTTLVVVGAGHLVGPVSVVELLEELGYEVRRL